MATKLTWKKSIQIPDGIHEGKIVRIEQVTEPYSYTNIYIALKDFDTEIKYGCPSTLSEKSKLGRFAIAMGLKVEVDNEIDLDIVIGRMVSFMTLGKKNPKDGNTYAEIIEDSIKPITI